MGGTGRAVFSCLDDSRLGDTRVRRCTALDLINLCEVFQRIIGQRTKELRKPHVDEIDVLITDNYIASVSDRFSVTDDRESDVNRCTERDIACGGSPVVSVPNITIICLLRLLSWCWSSELLAAAGDGRNPWKLRLLQGDIGWQSPPRRVRPGDDAAVL